MKKICKKCNKIKDFTQPNCCFCGDRWKGWLLLSAIPVSWVLLFGIVKLILMWFN